MSGNTVIYTKPKVATMSDMKCPFCNRNLHKGEDGIYSHLDYMTECKGRLFDGSKALWQELIRTKELLDIECSEHEMCHTQMLKTTEKLERTRKALDVAVDALKDIAESDGDFITGASTPLDEHEYADMMLKEIKRQMKTKTALEQKDVK